MSPTARLSTNAGFARSTGTLSPTRLQLLLETIAPAMQCSSSLLVSKILYAQKVHGFVKLNFQLHILKIFIFFIFYRIIKLIQKQGLSDNH